MRSDTGEMFGRHRIATAPGVEQAREALSEVFLPVDFPSARASSIVDLRLNALTVGRVTCGYMRFRDAVCIETAEAENFHVDIPLSGRTTMQAAFGSPIYGTPGTAGVFMPGRPVQLDCGEGFAQLSVMIPRADLQRELEHLLGDEQVQPLEFTAELDATAPGGRMMMQALRAIDQASQLDGGPLSHPLARQRLEEVLMQSLLFAQPHNHSAALGGPAPSPGAHPVSRAVELLRGRPAHPWTVIELAAEVSVSVRSLQQGFRRTLHTSPMAYLRTVRLERVRDELSLAAPGTVSVTEVASRWGFVHLGRFAAAYRSAFGEHPSDTMRTVSAHREN